MLPVWVQWSMVHNFGYKTHTSCWLEQYGFSMYRHINMQYGSILVRHWEGGGVSGWLGSGGEEENQKEKEYQAASR
ncbi:hypothetical protein BHE74_00013151 [Ensete ventricosum]|nr:hypothetical protein BHE74_00013151 [Ensete ventricosum]RZR76416.1 hypothetical protein BHM03_00001200 [Ensete ventricosum]